MENNSPAAELQQLEARINALLPPRYVGCFEEVAPTSMGSATLRYDNQGKIMWGEIWTTFCHLALAGGPPHRGRLLNAITVEEVQAAPQEYESVATELKRALRLCVELPIAKTSPPGWVGLQCKAAATAAWLVRAIIAENVFARHEGDILYVPAGPQFRIEKELKNVVVSVAKTCHYLFDHLDPEKQPAGSAPVLIRPPLPEELAEKRAQCEQAAVELRRQIHEQTGLATRLGDPPGWVGVELADEETAVWLLRAVAVEDILVRREGAVLYVPVDMSTNAIVKTAAAVVLAHRLSQLRG